MTTALAQRPATAAPRAFTKGGLLRRVGQLRQTSPGRLQLLLTVLLVLGALTGLIGGLTARSAAAGTSDLGGRAQPLLIEAETIYSALADAEATAAQAFLAGGLEPRELTQRYDDDLARATTALAAAARRTAGDGQAAGAVRQLATGIPRYAALVASARAANRQALPVGSAYLAAAAKLNRQTLLPQAQFLVHSASGEVRGGYAAARSSWWLALLVLLTAGLLIALVRAQLYLSRTTRRTFNVPLVAATVVTALLALGGGAILTVQRVHLDRAGQKGSTPIGLLAEGRTLVLRERGDEALTLAARGGSDTYEQDFRVASGELGSDRGPLLNSWSALGPDVDALMRRAADQHAAYVALHDRVRELDDSGRYDEAVKLATGPEATAAFKELTDSLDTAIQGRKAAFEAEIEDAGRGLVLLSVLAPLAGLAICVLAAIGIRARLEEYR